jgi:type I site-specific restriction endonuclease
MAETPEQRARREIDADLTAAGWHVQDRAGLSRGLLNFESRVTAPSLNPTQPPQLL